MKHRTTPMFWKCHEALPESIRDLADKNFALSKADSSHPSLHSKRLADFDQSALVVIIGRWPSKGAMALYGFGSEATPTMIA